MLAFKPFVIRNSNRGQILKKSLDIQRRDKREK